MRPLFRRPNSVTATLVCLSAVYACGGGDSLESEPFPAAAGVYNVTGRFDDLPSATSYFTGTLTLTQVSRQSGDLAGSISLVLRVEDEIIETVRAGPVPGQRREHEFAPEAPPVPVPPALPETPRR